MPRAAHLLGIPLTWYHCTTEGNVDKILKEGLGPGSANTFEYGPAIYLHSGCCYDPPCPGIEVALHPLTMLSSSGEALEVGARHPRIQAAMFPVSDPHTVSGLWLVVFAPDVLRVVGRRS